MRLFAAILLVAAAASATPAPTMENMMDECMYEKYFEGMLKAGGGEAMWQEFIQPGPKSQDQADALSKLLLSQMNTAGKLPIDFKEECENEMLLRRTSYDMRQVLLQQATRKIETVEEDTYLSFTQLVTKYKYPVEDYHLTTEDGYVLNLHRIPYGKDGPSDNRPVVFLMHGILASSVDWIIPGPEKGLGYIMADAGYDVWLGNGRGNRYSRNHSSWDVESKKFWDFSWHEIGTIDLPRMIDFALEKTGEKALFYIGHSQGTTSFYVMCSERPAYNAKIRAHFSLAPIAYMSHMTSPLFKVIALAEGGLEVLLRLIGMNEFLPTNGFLHKIAQAFCEKGGIMELLCHNSLFVMCGFNKAQLNTTLLPILMGHTPAGSSTKQFLHFAQEINSGKFRRYDYGLFGNPKHYGQIFPPKYNLGKINAPVYLFYSHNDWLSAKRDVLKLYKELKNARGKFLVADNKWNHLDYMFGIDAYDLVYSKVLSLMTRH